MIEEAWQRLYSSDKIGSSVIMRLLFSLTLSPREVKLLKFEDINIESKIPSIKIYGAKTNRIQVFSILQELYDGLK